MKKLAYGLFGIFCLLLGSSSYGASKPLVISLGASRVPMTFLQVPAGEFMMGSPSSEGYRRANERQHPVSLTKSFWLGQTEVTQEQWTAVMGANPSKHLGEKNLPVEYVSWDDAMAFCDRLTKQARGARFLTAKQRFTLPTEAQWEYACRAGSKTAFAFGTTLDGTQANFDGNHPYGKSDQAPKYVNATVPVGSYAGNAWGFKDMHGNVMEWCLDWYKVDLGASKAVNPAELSQGTYKVYRGGNFRDIGAFCRSAFRYFNLSHFRYGYLGFRVALVEE